MSEWVKYWVNEWMVSDVVMCNEWQDEWTRVWEGIEKNKKISPPESTLKKWINAKLPFKPTGGILKFWKSPKGYPLVGCVIWTTLTRGRTIDWRRWLFDWRCDIWVKKKSIVKFWRSETLHLLNYFSPLDLRLWTVALAIAGSRPRGRRTVWYDFQVATGHAGV